MVQENAIMAERASIGVGLETHDQVLWQAEMLLKKYEGDWTAEEIEAGLAGGPYEVIREAGNLLMTNGANILWNALTGATPVFYTNALARIGVGDSTTAASAAQTDLSATLAATTNITSSTNATPISVLSTAHGLVTNDTCTIVGHTTNTNANGTWVVTVTDANNFTLTGSVGNGVGGATGTVAKGNRFRKAMDATYPIVTTNSVAFRSTFAALEGNYVWNEWAVFNALSAGTMLNRKVESLGTKAGGSWQLTVTLSLS